MLFFVMVAFLFEALVLVGAIMGAEDNWIALEAFISNAAADLPDSRARAAPVAAQLLSTYKATRFHWCRRVCLPAFLWGGRIAEAREELRYALLRDRLVNPPASAAGPKVLPPDFDFSNYLRRCAADTLSHVLHVSVSARLAGHK